MIQSQLLLAKTNEHRITSRKALWISLKCSVTEVAPPGILSPALHTTRRSFFLCHQKQLLCYNKKFTETIWILWITFVRKHQKYRKEIMDWPIPIFLTQPFSKKEELPRENYISHMRVGHFVIFFNIVPIDTYFFWILLSL